MAVCFASVLLACLGYAGTIDVYPGPGTPIQSAIAAATKDAVIVVHPGTYQERIDFLGKAITIRGTDPDNADTVAATIIDGQAGGSVVKFATKETRASVLEGLKICSGGNTYWGGGVYCSGASPTIRKCLITGNNAGYGGGGIYCGSLSSPLIEANTVSSNPTGGGVYCGGNSNAEIVGNTFYQNSGGNGGAIQLDGVTASISGNVFDGNTANYGGAIYAWAVTGGSVSHNLFRSNGASWAGAICCRYCTNLELAYNTLLLNSAYTSGGGAVALDSSSITVHHLLIAGNSAPCGAGVDCESCSPELRNLTVVGNVATNGGAIHAGLNSSPKITSCIIAHQSKGAGIYSDRAQPVVSYCDVFGNAGGDCVGVDPQTGSGNVSLDPLFQDVTGGDYHLKSEAGRYDPKTSAWVKDPVSSPCIDAGDPAVTCVEPIPNGGRINMGFYGDTDQASKSQEVYFTAAPTGSPNPCQSGASVQCQALAVCRQGHDLTYTWTATDASGARVGSWDDRHKRDAVWTAPQNRSDATKTYTLALTVTCTSGAFATGSFIEEIAPPADAVTITAPPSGTPNPVASSGKVQCSVTAEDTRDHQLSYQWTAEDAQGNTAGSFDDPTKQDPVWTAPENRTGHSEDCTIQVTVTCTGGKAGVRWYDQAVSTMGDVDGDGQVSDLDLAEFTKAWRLAHSGDDGWNRKADLDGDTNLEADDARLMLGVALSAEAEL